MNTRLKSYSPTFSLIMLLFLMAFSPWPAAMAQSEVTGAFQGSVTGGQNSVPNALVRFINMDTQIPVATRADNQGQFYKGNLYPVRYLLEVSADGYQTKKIQMSLPTMKSTVVIPVPVTLEPVVVANTTSPAVTPQPAATPQPEVKPPSGNQPVAQTANKQQI